MINLQILTPISTINNSISDYVKRNVVGTNDFFFILLFSDDRDQNFTVTSELFEHRTAENQLFGRQHVNNMSRLRKVEFKLANKIERLVSNNS